MPAPQPLYELRPLGAGEILDYTRRLYQRVFPLAIIPTAILQGPFSAVIIYVTNVVSGVSKVTTPEQVKDFNDNISNFPYWIERIHDVWGIDWSPLLAWTTTTWIWAGFAFWLYCIVIGMAGAINNAGIIAVAGERWLGYVPTAQTLWRAWKRTAWRAIGITLLQGLIVALSIFIPFLIIGAGALVSNTGLQIALILIGGLLMLAASLFTSWFTVATFLAECALVVEDLGVMSSFKRSMALASGNWWRIFGSVMILQMVVQLVTSVVSGVGTLMLGFAFPRYLLLSMTLVQLTSSLFVTPALLVQKVLIYFDLRIRKEAFDLYYLTGGTPPPEAESIEPAVDQPALSL
ncbi:MAG: hypothetical protein ABI743_01535 [bacterium]